MSVCQTCGDTRQVPGMVTWTPPGGKTQGAGYGRVACPDCTNSEPGTRPPSATEQRIRAQSTQTLVVSLQRLSKDVGYIKNKWARGVILDEAARRLTEFDRLCQDEHG